MLYFPEEGTDSEELPLSNSHEQAESLWVKIKNRTSKRQPVPDQGSADTAALLQVCWQTPCIFESDIQVVNEDLKSIGLKIELCRAPLVTGHQFDVIPFTIT